MNRPIPPSGSVDLYEYVVMCIECEIVCREMRAGYPDGADYW